MFFPSTVAEAKLQLGQLLDGCPLCEPTAECPIERVRRLPRQERERWLADLDDAEAVRLCREHACCWRARTGDH